MMHDLDAMMQAVRTTVTIEDTLLAELKRLALRQERSVSSVLEDAIRMLLERVETPTAKDFELPVFRGQLGLRPGVDLEDREALHDLLDEV